MLTKNLKIIAGPCSLNYNNIEELYRISEIQVNGKSAIWGVRAVGLKSRTSLHFSNKYMGIDFKEYYKILNMLSKNASLNDIPLLPSMHYIQEFKKYCKLLIATEIINPLIQLSLFSRILGKKELLAWNPSVNQLGQSMLDMSILSYKNGFYIGIKNSRDNNINYKKMENKQRHEEIYVEKIWKGLAKYSMKKIQNPVLIHRGFGAIDGSKFRNIPSHIVANNVKKNLKTKLFLDPSHICGPLLRDYIISFTIDAMKIKMDDNSYLYDGILIEAGTSHTDTHQHITLRELEILCQELSTFRNF